MNKTYLKFIFHIAFTLTIVFQHTSINAQKPTKTKTETLKHLYKDSNSPFHRLEILLLLAENEKNLIKAIEYSEKAIYLSDSLNLKNYKAKALNISGNLWKNLGHYSISIQKLEKANSIYQKQKLYNCLNKNRIDLAEAYRASAVYETAIITLLNPILYFELTNDTFNLARAYNRLAAILIELTYKNEEYLDIINNTFLDKEQTLLKLKQTSTPYHYYKTLNYSINKSIELAKKQNNIELIFSNLILRGFSYSLVKDFEKTIEIYNYVILNSKKLDLKDELTLTTINLARIYSYPPYEDYEKAINLAYISKKIANKEKKNIYIFLSNQILIRCYLAQENYEKAFKYLERNEQMSNTFEGEKLRLSLLTQEFEKKITTKEFEIKLREKINRILVIGITLIIIIFTIFITIITKKNTQLKKFLRIVKAKNEVISKQKDSLFILNRDKDRIFSIIAHDLRNSVSGILGLSLILHKDNDKLDKEKINKINSLIYSSSTVISDILDNLLSWGKIHFDRITFEPTEVSFHEIVKNKITLFEDLLQKKEIKFEYRPNEDIIFKADKEVLNTILRNLINNAIKFSKKGGKIEVSAILQENEIKISVKDFGVGMNTEKAKNLFSYSKYISTKGTNNEEGIGLGLLLCKELLEKFDGKIWVESEEDKGSTFYFTLKNKARN